MSISAKNDYKTCKIDVITGFIYRFPDMKTYIIQPTLFEDSIMRVCSSKKLYIAQNSLCEFDIRLFLTLLDFLRKLNLHKIESDHSLFVLTHKTFFIAVYVDYLLFFAADIYS